MKKNVASSLHAKEGLIEADSCTKFDPDEEILKLMQNDKGFCKNIRYNDTVAHFHFISGKKFNFITE